MNNNDIFDLTNKYIMNTYKRFPIALKEGNGIYLYDYDGNEYIDCLSGISVNALGYSHPEIIEAINNHSKGLIHTSNLFYTKNQSLLAKTLVENSDSDKVFFCNSGAEANEAALKLARKWGKGRYEVISTINSFHGRTLGALSATGQTKYQKGFEPILAGFKFIEYNNYEAFKNSINENTVAFIIEPLQAEGGIICPNKEYIYKVAELCKEKNILLIFDEVQTGICRTGKLFAYQHYGVKPDIVTLAKALGAGLPIGVMLAKDSVAESFEPGNHASTFGGGEFVTGIALHFLNFLINNNIAQHVTKVGEYFLNNLKKIADKHNGMIKEARGMGLLLGIELRDNMNHLETSSLFIKNGLLCALAGNNVIRFAPPLIIEIEHINKIIKIIDDIFNNIKE